MNHEDFRLKPLEADDLETVLTWRNSERVRMNMYHDKPISLDEHVAWFERMKQNSRQDYQIFMMKEQPVGLVNFTDIDVDNGKCYWGFYIGDTKVPRGTGTIMGYFGLEHIFEKRGMRKVTGEVLAFNEASIRFHERLGFQKEGHFIKHVKKANQYIDVISFAIFQANWQNTKILIKKQLLEKMQVK